MEILEGKVLLWLESARFVKNKKSNDNDAGKI